MSPSALIPFCDFGGNMSSVGLKIDQFHLPVCNSFQAKILNDQLCYEIDLNKFSNKANIERELKLGFNFIMDYNEDKQVTFDTNTTWKEEDSLALRSVQTHEKEHAFIYLNTIGRQPLLII